MKTSSNAPVRLFGLAMLLLIVPGCAMTTATVATNESVCDVWKPISWSQKDTDETIVQVKVNNARRNGWCHG